MTSRRKLYAQFEPLGDNATRREGRKIIYGDGGGGGSSSSSSSTTTNNTDARVVGGNQSTNISTANSTVTVTDQGAVQAAFGFAENVSGQAFDFAHASQVDTTKTVEDAMGKVADAYSTAKAGEQKIFAGAALAVVGVVAFVGLKRA